MTVDEHPVIRMHVPEKVIFRSDTVANVRC